MSSMRMCGLLVALLLGLNVGSTSGTQLAMPPNGGRVRVAVMGLFHPQQFTVETFGSQPLLISTAAGELALDDHAQSHALLRGGGGHILLQIADRSITGQEIKVAGRQGDSDFVLGVPGKLRRRYHGRLTVRPQAGELLAIVEMELDTAVASIVAAEAPPGASLEALKAQAVASRSFLVAGGARHAAVESCDTTHCQFLREPPPDGSPAALAASTTRGLVITFRGVPVRAMYSASCGGRPHTLAELGYRALEYPFFAIPCNACRRNPERWTSTVTEADAAALKAHDDSARTRLGRKLGWWAAPSNTYQAKAGGAGVVLEGVGRGHGVGLCQRGAAAMAREGNDFRQILAYYFPNTTLESVSLR